MFYDSFSIDAKKYFYTFIFGAESSIILFLTNRLSLLMCICTLSKPWQTQSYSWVWEACECTFVTAKSYLIKLVPLWDSGSLFYNLGRCMCFPLKTSDGSVDETAAISGESEAIKGCWFLCTVVRPGLSLESGRKVFWAGVCFLIGLPCPESSGAAFLSSYKAEIKYLKCTLKKELEETDAADNETFLLESLYFET